MCCSWELAYLQTSGTLVEALTVCGFQHAFCCYKMHTCSPNLDTHAI